MSSPPSVRGPDSGCSTSEPHTGAAPIALAGQLGLITTGVDVDPEQIALATVAADGTDHVDVVTAGAAALPFADGEFDLVITNKTTHHIPNWPQVFAEMVRVLKPGGLLIYSDFVAPFGRRVPTRRALRRLADEHKPATVRRSRAPFRYTATFTKPA